MDHLVQLGTNIYLFIYLRCVKKVVQFSFNAGSNEGLSKQ